MNETPVKRRRFRFGLRTLFGGITLCALLLGLWANWDYIPGTFRLDDHGFPHGTGTMKWFYESGALQIEENFRNGFIQRSTWYRPDGSVIASSEFDIERGGIGYFLRDDGTIRVKMQFKFTTADKVPEADGEAIYYNPDGSVDRTVEFRDGVEVKPDQSAKDNS